MTKVLIIEDDIDQALLYKAVFEMSDFEVIVSNGGIEGLAKAEAWQPDVILLDIVMGDLGGKEVLQKLKEHKHTSSIPVVVLTNVFKKGIVEEVKSLGAVDFWEKTKTMPRDVVEGVKKILHLV